MGLAANNIHRGWDKAQESITLKVEGRKMKKALKAVIAGTVLFAIAGTVSAGDVSISINLGSLFRPKPVTKVVYYGSCPVYEEERVRYQPPVVIIKKKPPVKDYRNCNDHKKKPVVVIPAYRKSGHDSRRWDYNDQRGHNRSDRRDFREDDSRNRRYRR